MRKKRGKMIRIERVLSGCSLMTLGFDQCRRGIPAQGLGEICSRLCINHSPKECR